MSTVVVRKDRFSEISRAFSKALEDELRAGANDIKSKSATLAPRKVKSRVKKTQTGFEVLWGSQETFWASFVELGTQFQTARPFATPAAEDVFPAIRRALSNMERYIR